MSTVALDWITPEAERRLIHMARVSSPESQIKGFNPERLLKYLRRKKHWSPFDMVDACFQIDTTRDIAHQILRHWSFKFQEFSQRYSAVDKLPAITMKEARLQDDANRQNSISISDPELQKWWDKQQRAVIRYTNARYKAALAKGLAKECARVVLPEGLTPTRLYMKGTARSWIHYLDQRCVSATQKEHREVALAIEKIMRGHMPATFPRTRRK